MFRQKDLVFRTARNEWERLQTRRIIEQTFIDELGYVGMRPDIYNDTAIFICAALDNKIIATVRMIIDSEISLPLDKYIDLSNVRKKGRVLAELSRLACVKEYRSARVAVNGIGFVKEVAEKLAVTHLLIDSFIHTVPLYARMGFKMLGEPFFDQTISQRNSKSHQPNAVLLMAATEDVKTLERNNIPKILSE